MKEDNTLSPSYYNRDGISCSKIIQVITTDLSGFEAYAIGNTIKYLYRYMNKNGVEDLRKALTYIELVINNLEGGDLDDYYEPEGNDPEYEERYKN